MSVSQNLAPARSIWFLMLFIGWIALFAGLVFLPDDLLPERFTTDSDLIENIANGVASGDISRAFEHTATFFAMLGPLTKPFLVMLGVVTFSVFTSRVMTVQALIFAFFITISPFLMGMIRPQKEIIVAILALASYAAAPANRKEWVAIAIVVGLYGIYAALFRPYYALIAAVFGGLYIWSKASSGQRALLAGGLILAYAFLPNEVLTALQEPRDIINQNRVYLRPEASRSAFFNPYPDVDHITFLGNYAYAFIRINIPLLFDQTFAEIFLTLNLAAYAYLLAIVRRSQNQQTKLLTRLFIAHFIVLPVFEPDLGSYLRHISSVFVYLTPALLAFDARFRKPEEKVAAA